MRTRRSSQFMGYHFHSCYRTIQGVSWGTYHKNITKLNWELHYCCTDFPYWAFNRKLFSYPFQRYQNKENWTTFAHVCSDVLYTSANFDWFHTDTMYVRDNSSSLLLQSPWIDVVVKISMTLKMLTYEVFI